MTRLEETRAVQTATPAAARLARLCVVLFAITSMFPIGASMLAGDPPRWLGVADVGFAAVLAITAIAVAMRTQGHVSDVDRLAAFRASQRLVSIIPVLLVLFFVAGSRFKWDVLVIGLGWRAWLLLYSLPSLVAARRDGRPTS